MASNFLSQEFNQMETHSLLQRDNERDIMREKELSGTRDRERQSEREWVVINMLQSGCISEGHWEETTGHYSTTKGLLISLLGFN